MTSCATAPQCAVPLGTGYGALAAEAHSSIPAQIPAHPLTSTDTAPAHSGEHSGAPIPAQGPAHLRRTHSGAPTFTAWLLGQAMRLDWIGHLAQDVAEDLAEEGWPADGQELAQFVVYLDSLPGVAPEAYQARAQAREEWRSP